MPIHPSAIELSKNDPWLAERLRFEDDPANFVKLGLKSSALSPFLASTISAVRALENDFRKPLPTRGPNFGKREDPRRLLMQLNRPAIALRVTIASADRALILMNSLIEACEARDLAVSIVKQTLQFGRDGHWISVRISEGVVEKVAPMKGFTASEILMKDHITRFGNGNFTFFVKRHSSESKVMDTEGIRLEQMLNSVIKLIWRGIAESTAWREYFEESMRRWKIESMAREAEQQAARNSALEEQRLEDARVAREQNLIADALAWQQAQAVRAYVSSRMTTKSELGDDAATWQTWALQVADQVESGEIVQLNQAKDPMPFTGESAVTARENQRIIALLDGPPRYVPGARKW